jgi:hypothetical protein
VIYLLDFGRNTSAVTFNQKLFMASFVSYVAAENCPLFHSGAEISEARIPGKGTRLIQTNFDLMTKRHSCKETKRASKVSIESKLER